MKKLAMLSLGILMSLNSFSKELVRVGLVLSTGGLGDKSFNDSAYRGLEKAKKELGIEFKFVEPASPAEDEEFLREYADADYDLIIGTGFLMTDALKSVANDYPDKKFAIIDDVVELPNVRSLNFKDQEGSFLMGALAAMMSKTGTVGFVGGMESSLIKRFESGYEQGAKYINPNIKVLSVYTTGTNPFNDPVRGKENAISEINQGADVVYHAAGGTGMGVIDAAKEKGVYAIGVDSNQDEVAPGVVLTSMLKNVDVAVYNAVKDIQENKFTTGNVIYGIAENGVGTTEFEFTREIIGEDNLKKLEDIKTKISDKSIIIK
ncbi:BMP family ABC transporter substrate-binding protein [Cetobacterium sp. 2A]|uniref:BMP family lipoprotein n=1 Tax=Cetobacterium sp. 2A TaxID=2754723 RepID=UPI00163D1C60|nr:BMP family ABC transporter substrate-binding protein [Cetobacterium sp. 2A]MBC2855712.1 BMP family ABC transporter substrate-binding protein [Cetobacterium sp. 2A]